ncbi:EVI2B protein, partial [Heliornis fulica]|nr:EVI2B protein [Heliornis fulica]
MATKQVILLLLWGEIWRSLSTAIPQEVPTNNISARSPGEDKAPLSQAQATELSLQISGKAPVPTAPLYPDQGDGSWIAALMIGIILISMIVAIVLIVLWKCCRRPALVDSNWAGRSPFSEGDTPDVFMDCDQAAKRSSVLFMLPWKLQQDTTSQHNPAAMEKPPNCTSNARGQLPPPADNGSAASTSPPDRATSPTPTSAAASCPPSPTCPELPPPPDWLREPAGDSPGLSEGHWPSGVEEPLPPPPEML